MEYGVDFSLGRPSTAALTSTIPNLGRLRFVARYYSHNRAKALGKAEADGYLAAGLDIVTVWEDTARAPEGGRGRGVLDAKEAAKQAAACGQPAGTCIYFAVDFDAQQSSYGTLAEYFEGVRSSIGKWRVGGYGGAGPMQSLRASGHIDFVWQTTGFSHGKVLPTANLLQITHQVTIDGVVCDVNQIMAAEIGGWNSEPAKLHIPRKEMVDVNLTREFVNVNLDAAGKGWTLVNVPFDKIVSVLVNAADPRTNGYQPVPMTAADAYGSQTQIELVDGPPHGVVGVFYWQVA
ncbi:MAG TPA: glycoside hydrolase domain-containing protein [Acidimicrobiales bacterium]|nr:glycoside hydrolase domain-containing protein [Acidimicrobiales bacterium]